MPDENDVVRVECKNKLMESGRLSIDIVVRMFNVAGRSPAGEVGDDDVEAWT
ncbi:hypothetical protein D3C80_1918730 [compost metagenome]